MNEVQITALIGLLGTVVGIIVGFVLGNGGDR